MLRERGIASQRPNATRQADPSHGHKGKVQGFRSRSHAITCTTEIQATNAMANINLRRTLAIAALAILAPSAAAFSWVPASNPATPRSFNGVTLLPNGKVLVVGGSSMNVPLASSELYDPTTGTWSSAGNLAVARELVTATLLHDGRVLVAGGHNGTLPNTALNAAEVYQPANNTWSSTFNLLQARSRHTVTLLQNGRVLAVGGFNDAEGVLSSAELYDPVSGSWSSAGVMASARYAHTATLLANGKVLVAGGMNATSLGLRSAELFDPATNNWSPASAMAVGHADATSALLRSGGVLVAGGATGTEGVLAVAELYDPQTDVWTSAGAMSDERVYHAATLLADGKLLVAGGTGNPEGSFATYLTTAEVYDPAVNRWSPAGSMSRAYPQASSVLLLTGQAIVIGPIAVDIFTPDFATTHAVPALGVGQLIGLTTLVIGVTLFARRSPQPSAKARRLSA
jgi:N-acetylneuraminic acid mutarotase